jgi:hypothetical protein
MRNADKKEYLFTKIWYSSITATFLWRNFITVNKKKCSTLLIILMGKATKILLGR